MLTSELPILTAISVIAFALWGSQTLVGRLHAAGWAIACMAFGVVLAFSDNQSDPYAMWLVCMIASLFATGFAIWQCKRRRTVPAWAIVTAMAASLVIFAASLPPKLAVREAPKRSICKGNLKQLGLFLWEAVDQTGGLPQSRSGDPPRSWRVDMLGMAGESDLRKKYLDSLTWDHQRNAQVAQRPPYLFICPTNFNGRDHAGRAFTAYAAITGRQAAMSTTEIRSPRNMTDGTSETVLLIEACGQEIVWTEPRDIDIDSVPIGINLDGTTKTTSPGVGSSYHTGGCHVLMADGSVRFISQNVSQETLKALLTTNGGEAIDEF